MSVYNTNSGDLYSDGDPRSSRRFIPGAVHPTVPPAATAQPSVASTSSVMGPVAQPAVASQPTTPALPEFSYDLGGVNPTTDLIYNSFLRGAGFDNSTARAQADYARQQAQAQLQAQIPALQQQLQEGLVNVGDSAAARGAARSSSRLQSQNTLERDIAGQENAARANAADQQAQAQFSLQNQLNSSERQRGEAELDARTRLVQEQNKQIAYQRALQELGLQ